MSSYISHEIEFRYCFNGEQKLLDALVLSKSELELLYLFKEIARLFDVTLRMETLVAQDSEEGIVRRLRLSYKQEKRLAAPLMTALLAYSLAVPVNRLPLVLPEHKEFNRMIPKFLKEGISLEDERKQVMGYVNLIAQSTKVIRRVSNYYEELFPERRLSKITIRTFNEKGKSILTEKQIKKSEFRNHILKTDDLSSETDEQALIAIVSPVFGKDNLQWKGIYQGEMISFNMKSEEFRNAVEAGEIEFKTGTCITCILEKERKIDKLGNIIVKTYNILQVLSHFDGTDRKTETKEGRKYRKQKEAEKLQLDLFGF